MEAVDVLVGIDREQDMRRVDVLGQRQLHQDAVHGRIAVQPGDQLQQLGFGRALGQAMVEARHAELGRDAALAPHIDLAGGIVADQHRGEAGLHALGRDQLGDALAHALAQGRREGLAVDQFRLKPFPHSLDDRRRLTRDPTVLARAVWPLITSNDDFGRRHCSASRAITAALALPSSGGAVTCGLERAVRRLERRAPGTRLDTQIDGHARRAAPQETGVDQ